MYGLYSLCRPYLDKEELNAFFKAYGNSVINRNCTFVWLQTYVNKMLNMGLKDVLYTNNVPYSLFSEALFKSWLPLINDFLKENAVYHQFYLNLLKDRDANNLKNEIYKYLDYFIHSPYQRIDGFIYNAFNWRTTTEGHKFWSGIASKFYYVYLTKLIIE